MSYLSGVIRSCDAPACPATYEALTGPVEPPGRHWRAHRTFSLHLCPDHSWLWGPGDGPHVPRLDHATRSPSCSCGLALSGGTLGEMAGSYKRHIKGILV